MDSEKTPDEVNTLNPVIGMSISDVLAVGRTEVRQGLLQLVIFAEHLQSEEK